MIAIETIEQAMRYLHSRFDTADVDDLQKFDRIWHEQFAEKHIPDLPESAETKRIYDQELIDYARALQRGTMQ